MTPNAAEEFYSALAIIGGIYMLMFVLTGVFIWGAISIRGKFKEDKIIKKIYEQKRENGHKKE